MSAERRSPCPRHGNEHRVDIPGLRCDCPETVQAVVGALKRGKWVRAALYPARDNPVFSYDALADAVEDRANRAVDEALMAGYRLGLAGGVRSDRVRTCVKCGETIVADKILDDPQVRPLCITCFADTNA